MARRPLGAKTTSLGQPARKRPPLLQPPRAEFCQQLHELEENPELPLRPRHGRHLHCSFVRPCTEDPAEPCLPSTGVEAEPIASATTERARLYSVWLIGVGAGIHAVTSRSGSFFASLPFTPLCEYATTCHLMLGT